MQKDSNVISGRWDARVDQRLLLATLAVAAILRFIGANAEFWFDEIITVRDYVRLPIPDIISSYAKANNHVLNSLLARVTASIVGEHPWSVRLPSLLFGIGGVWAFHAVARHLWNKQVLFLGTLMFAVSYHHVYYTQMARGYSAFVFFALAANAMLLHLVTSSDADANRAPLRRYAIAYAGAIGLGLYSLLLMVFVVAGHGCVLLATRRWRMIGWLIGGAAIAMLLYSPMAAAIISYYSSRPGSTGNALFSAAFLRELRPAIPLLIVALIVAPPLMLRLWKRNAPATALLLLPLAFNIVVPVVRGQGLHPRSLIYGLPVAYFFLMELLDWAWNRPRLRWVSAVGAAAIIVISIGMLARYYPLPKQGFQQALRYIAQHRDANDARVGLSLGGKAARFYDPSIPLIDSPDDLRTWEETAPPRAWVLYTFAGQLRHKTPELHDWLMRATTHQATFPGVIGDGAVHVRLLQR